MSSTNDLKESVDVNSFGDKASKFISDNKSALVLSLLAVSFSTVIHSVRKKVAGTKDFGMKKLVDTPGMIPQHAAWIWTIRAFAVSTAIVGLGATGVAASISYGMGVSSVKEFSIEFKRFPSLKHTEEKESMEEAAMVEFMDEFVRDLKLEEESANDEEGIVSLTV